MFRKRLWRDSTFFAIKSFRTVVMVSDFLTRTNRKSSDLSVYVDVLGRDGRASIIDSLSSLISER